MSSKNDILSAIRRHTGKRYDMPELTLDAITYEDKILPFTDSLKAAGGHEKNASRLFTFPVF